MADTLTESPPPSTLAELRKLDAPPPTPTLDDLRAWEYTSERGGELAMKELDVARAGARWPQARVNARNKEFKQKFGRDMDLEEKERMEGDYQMHLLAKAYLEGGEQMDILAGKAVQDYAFHRGVSEPQAASALRGLWKKMPGIAITAMDTQERERFNGILQKVAQSGKAKAPEGWAEKALARFLRSGERAGMAPVRMLSDVSHVIDTGGEFGERERARSVQQQIVQNFNPAKGDSFASEAALGVVENVPTLAASVIAFGLGGYAGGFAFWSAQTIPDVYQEMRQDGFDHRTAQIGASIGGSVEAAIEMVIDPIRQLRGMPKGMKLDISRPIRQVVKEYMKTWAGEYSEEFYQGLTRMLTKEITSQFDQSVDIQSIMSEKGFEHTELYKVLKGLPQAAAVVGMISGMGGAGGTIQGLGIARDSQALLNNPEAARIIAARKRTLSRKEFRDLGLGQARYRSEQKRKNLAQLSRQWEAMGEIKKFSESTKKTQAEETPDDALLAPTPGQEADVPAGPTVPSGPGTADRAAGPPGPAVAAGGLPAPPRNLEEEQGQAPGREAAEEGEERLPGVLAQPTSRPAPQKPAEPPKLPKKTKLTQQERTAMIMEVGLEVGTGKALRETEQAVMDLLKADTMGEIAPKLRTANEKLVRKTHALVMEAKKKSQDKGAEEETPQVPKPEAEKVTSKPVRPSKPGTMLETPAAPKPVSITPADKREMKTARVDQAAINARAEQRGQPDFDIAEATYLSAKPEANEVSASRSIGRLKKFIQTVPEFKLDPVFTVDEDGNLSFKDGGEFTLVPQSHGIVLPEGAQAGQTVRIDVAAVLAAKVSDMKKEKRYFLAQPGGAKPAEAPKLPKSEAEKVREPKGEATESAAKKKARKSLEDAMEDFRAETNKLGANPFLNPKLYAKALNLIHAAVKFHGIYTFPEFIRDLVKKIGKRSVLGMSDDLYRAWEETRLKRGYEAMQAAVNGEVEQIVGAMSASQAIHMPTPGPKEWDLPGIDEVSEEVLDHWIGEGDVHQTNANIQETLDQQDIAKLAGEKRYGKESKVLDEAMHVYIDIHGRAQEQLDKHGSKLSDEQKAVYERSQNLSPAEKKYADQMIDFNRRLGIERMEAEAIANYVENYTARMWKRGETSGGGDLGAFTLSTGRARQRSLESILHGWAKGKELQIKTATGAKALAHKQIARVQTDRNLIKTGIKVGVLSRQPATGFTELEHPNFKTWKRIGEAAPGRVYGEGLFVTPDGQLFQKVKMYGVTKMAKHINAALSKSKIKDVRGVKWASKWNTILKQMILVTGLFHHFAFLRSYVFGASGLKALDPLGAYKAGRKAIENWDPLFAELVYGGFTVGRIQDFDQLALEEKTLIGKVIDKVPMGKAVKDKLLELRDRQTAFLFNRMGPYLKVAAGLIEYQKYLKKYENQIISGTMSRKKIARTVASLMNADFGGLNHRRIGRDQTLQHAMRLTLLAPDWTESNVRTMVGAFQKGFDGEVYRAFWGRVILKGAITTFLANMLMAGLDDEEDIGDLYRAMWKEGHLRWTGVDVTPLLRIFNREPEDGRRKFFSLIGHFRDPIKFVFQDDPGDKDVFPDPLYSIGKSLKHKQSVAMGVVAEALTGTDWAGRRFTTLPELLGTDDKGTYQTTRRGYYHKGDPKGGKYAGQTVAFKFGGGIKPIGVSQLPSYVISQLEGFTPIQVQNAISFAQGEMDAFDAVARGLGLATSQSRRTNPKSAPHPDEQITQMAHRLAAARPSKRGPDRDDWNSQQVETIEWFREQGFSAPQIRWEYRRYLGKRYKTSKTRTEYMQRFNRNARKIGR